jgi:ORF6N domain
MVATKSETLVPLASIESRIYVVRGQNVMLDSELAELYEVTTKAFNQSVRRNRTRFPEDFMFQLTKDEDASLRSQIVTSKVGRGGRRYRPFVFTEQGVAMLSSVLNSERAVQVSIAIMRAFVRLREIVASHSELSEKLSALERKYDARFRIVFDAIRKLMVPPDAKRQRIGFTVSHKKKA